MKVHYLKLYNMAHPLALNVLLLPKDLTIILFTFIPGLASIYTSAEAKYTQTDAGLTKILPLMFTILQCICL